MERNKKGKIIRTLKTVVVYVATQRTVVIIALFVQLLILGFLFVGLSKYSTRAVLIFQLLAAITAVYILNTHSKAEMKLGWLVPMVAFPIFMVAIYFYLSNQHSARMVRKLYADKCAATKKYLSQDEETILALKECDEQTYRYACYMKDYAGYPVHQGSQVTYFRSGEEKFEVLKNELEKAKHYIFIEMFIVDQGMLWDELLAILKRKASEGVDVRFIYDGLASQSLLPFNYHKRLCQWGIQTRVFQPFVALLSSIQNNRDHRKIVVIDGCTGFTGGDNFADEYINRIERFGYWKDTAVMIKGEAVWNLTMMFLQMWEVVDRNGTSGGYESYQPSAHRLEKYSSDGFVLAYSDSPLDDEDVGELTYLNILGTAVNYCYISTPYLILSEEMLGALKFAAKRGVDVRIIVPGIPDKWYVKLLGEYFFDELMASGVRIYEYDGFNHAKMFVSDDEKAVVGTINLDYRSLYLHFENACFLYRVTAIKDIKADFLDMFENHCRELTPERFAERPFYRKLGAALLKIIEPML
ncbi:cardiolipin synthase [Ruminococcus sp. YE71]|uniref:cardiolipin synthase n=1 Tax=unclassified Ruminococcus TaxID=2608920 RepID=UPI000891A45C|nr:MULTISPECIES: cardiolipin synthase [unclassified Ruminococcus]SDA31790.1 cardiolipin synthase [Ruminococcus sp. YE78]SFW51918.1 cardiolipin synthase [Ruminococcus sp. YE71]